MAVPLFVLVLALCLHTGLSMESFKAEDGYEVFPVYNASRYKAYQDLEWDQALHQCESDGGGSLLAVINSKEEAQVVRVLLDRLDSTVSWVGINDIAEEGTWVTVQGGLVADSGYDEWVHSHPRQDPVMNCGYVLISLLYSDGGCSIAWPFICEKPNV